jgi:site-specific recombinase XerC
VPLTGLRIGELRALRWQDVELVAGKLLVTFASHLMMRSAPLKAVHELLGHAESA